MTVVAFVTKNSSEKPSDESMFCIPRPQLHPPEQNSFTTLQAAVRTCKRCLSTCAVCLCTFILTVSLLLFAFKPSADIINVVIVDVESPPIFITNKNFLSVALDSSVIAEDFRGFNMTNPKLEKLLSALAPGYFRVGGTMADRLQFVVKNEPRFKANQVSVSDGDVCAYENTKCDIYVRPNYTMSGEEWLTLNQFIAKSGFTLLFDLNCLTRFANGSWNFKNAESLIQFSDRHNLSVIWELGNEPDAFRHVFNYEVNATQLGRDFVVLKNILSKYPKYKNALLMGPDTTRPKPNHKESVEYLKEFLKVAGNIVDGITWHQYYLNGRTASGYDFINSTIFNLLQDQIDVIKSVVARAGLERKPIWLGETSSAYGGGAPDYSNRFISTFIWLDKLGLAAKNGLDLVIRQSFFKGYYALLYNDYTPAPDFWVSVLYKKLVGRQVLHCDKVTNENVRIYCQCANHNTSAIIVFALNVRPKQTKIRIMTSNDKQNYSENVLTYIIRTEYSLLSRTTILNDQHLSLMSDGSLPQFKPKIVSAQPYLVMPAYSLAFWVVPVPNLKYCGK